MSTPSHRSRNTPIETDLSGRTLGDYQILRRLGRGGMADVYLAEQKSLRRQVAIKVLKSSLAQDDTYVRRFHNEAQSAAALVHANIVHIHEVGCLDGIHFIAQEYIPGQNLRQLIAREGAVSVPQAVSIMRQVAAALNKSAEQGIVHRDIKPENIMLTPDGEVKVADFGLARVLNEGQVDVTQIGVTMGTPLYMSPEQVEGRPLDPRSDLYSFGVTCYFMLAGRPPFEGETALSVAVQHLKTEPDPLQEERDDLPEKLCNIVARSLAKNPADRYQHPQELLRDLRELHIEGEDIPWPAADSWSTGEYTSADGPRLQATQELAAVMQSSVFPPKKSRWKPALAGAAIAFLLGGAIAWGTRPPPLLEASIHPSSSVEKMGSAQEQYVYATLVGTPEAWKSVARHFPPEEDPQNRYYSRLSLGRLGEYYLDQSNYSAALEVFNALAAVEETEPQFRTTGLAGQALVYDLQGNNEEAAKKLARVLANRQFLPPSIRGKIDALAEKYRQGEG